MKEFIWNLIQNLRNHFIGVLVDPVVDVLTGLLVERRFVDIRTEVIRIGLQEILADCEAIVVGKPNGIGKAQLVFFALRQMVNIAVQVQIQIFDGHS